MKSIDDLGEGNRVVFNDVLDGLTEAPVENVQRDGTILVSYDGSSVILNKDEILAIRNGLGVGKIEAFPGRSYDILNQDRLEEAIEDNRDRI